MESKSAEIYSCLYPRRLGSRSRNMRRRKKKKGRKKKKMKMKRLEQEDHRSLFLIIAFMLKILQRKALAKI